MKWSENVWQQIETIYGNILKLPFNTELLQGVLSQEKFKFYITQDALYLGEFSRALALIAARSHSIENALQFIQFAERAIVIERTLHENYFKEFNIDTLSVPSPTCQNYTNYLLAKSSLDQVEVAMAALLPCFWIYKKVGDHIYQQQDNINNSYQNWINSYAGEEFGIIVQKAIVLCDEAAAMCSLKQLKAMDQAFIISSRFEWMFWNSAWQLEQWPI